MSRAITLSEIADLTPPKPASRSLFADEEKRYTMHEAVMVLHDCGFEVVRREPAVGWSGHSGLPVHFVARLTTACGATRELVLHWPPIATIRIPMVQQISAAWSADDHEPFSINGQVTVTNRSFNLQQVVSEQGQPVGIYREYV